MRFSFIAGVAIVVLIVAAFVALGLRSTSVTTESVPEEIEETIDTSGQFFQEVPLEEATSSAIPSPLGGAETSLVAEGEAGSATVTMSETGFSPATLTIAAGTVVHFINNGQAAHWPASDVHPTHNILSEFDAKRALATGESYSYTFEEAGTWRCHDHLMPQLTCTIIVE